MSDLSNLSVVSNLLERLVVQQLLAHLNTSGLLPRSQSAYRAGHSRRTAVLKVLSDILLANDTCDLFALALVLLDLAGPWTSTVFFSSTGDFSCYKKSLVGDVPNPVKFSAHLI